jgi:trehalose 6-phosphate synthase
MAERVATTGLSSSPPPEPTRPVLLASNRGPARLDAAAGRSAASNPGGAVGLLEAATWSVDAPVDWAVVAFPEEQARSEPAERHRNGRGHAYTVHRIAIEPALHDAYYNKVANTLLWTALHDLWSEIEVDVSRQLEQAWESGYETVNELVSRRLAGLAGDRCAILLQDYHLMRAPALVRRLRPDGLIAHFTHSAFDGAGVDRLPLWMRRSLVDGMLGADILGFHTEAWTTGFLRCCEGAGHRVDWRARRVEHGRSTWVREYPAPIDAKKITRRLAGERAEGWYRLLRSLSHGRLLVRVDRLDPSKNVIRSLQAYERLLAGRPDLRENARFVLSVYPSRTQVDQYRTYARNVRSLVDRVNARFPGAVRLFGEDDQDRGVAALGAYDVLIVNSIADGMNFVAREGPLVNRHDGVLVLTSTTGSAMDMGSDAITIGDPRDVAETARALERALDMDTGERRRRAGGLRALADRRTPVEWLHQQLGDLESVAAHGAPRPREGGVAADASREVDR